MAKPKIGKPVAGQGLSKGHTKKGISSTEEVLKAIRDELSSLKALGAVVAPAAATQTGAYVQADVQSIADLANELRTKLLAIAAIVDQFEK